MGMSKAQKALLKLKLRVETVECHAEAVKNWMDESKFNSMMNCKEEIKTLIEAYEKQVENNKRLNKKVVAQRGQLKVLNRQKKVLE